MADVTWANDKEKQPWIERPFDRPRLTKMWGIQRMLTLDVLLACFGLGTWLGVNGLYVQLPLLVEQAPEGWGLPASMALAVQLGNLGLVFYGLLRRLRPKASDSPYIYILLAIGVASLTLNAFFHHKTTTIAGNDHSFAFLTLTFFSALVGCTSSILFYPFLRHFREIYLATYLTGEGLSGFLPGIIALIQGVGGDPKCLPSEKDPDVLEQHFPPPRFQTYVYFLILAGLSLLSFFSFAALDNFKTYDSERVSSDSKKDDDAIEEVKPEKESLATREWVSIFALMGVLNAISNGMLPSIMSFSCMPYGSLAYHLAVTLSAMANPAACLVGVWLRPVSRRVLAVLLLLVLPPLAYIISTALMSPAPPLQHYAGGAALIVISWVVTSALISYARVWVYATARVKGTGAMRWCGVFVQIGSGIGSLVFFLLVNFTNLFTQSDPC